MTDIKDFVTSALDQITEAFKDIEAKHGTVTVHQGTMETALNELSLLTTKQGELVSAVRFDLAVTISDDRLGKTAGKLKLLSFGEFGAEGEASKHNATVQRLQFTGIVKHAGASRDPKPRRQRPKQSAPNVAIV